LHIYVNKAVWLIILDNQLSLAFVSGKDSLPVDLPKPIENEKTVEVVHSNVKPFSVHPLPPVCIITFCMFRKYQHNIILVHMCTN
jgi:hypothetical protein